MPFVNVKTNFKLEANDIESIKTNVGQIIRVIPGKSEQWLMTNIEDAQNLYHQGTKEKAIYVEVKIYGGRDPNSFQKFTSEITKFLSSSFGVSPNRIYVSYFPTLDWGWAGNNF